MPDIYKSNQNQESQTAALHRLIVVMKVQNDALMKPLGNLQGTVRTPGKLNKEVELREEEGDSNGNLFNLYVIFFHVRDIF